MRLTRPFRVAALVIVIGMLAPGAAFATSQSVVIQNFAFQPQTATINVGESITWLNTDPLNHTATSDTGAFDTGAIPPSGNKTVSFALAGNYTYHCAIHPTMKGTIVVLGVTPTPAASTPAPTQRPTPPPTAPPTTAAPTASQSPSPTPSPSPSASPSATPSPAPTATGTPIAVPTGIAAASPTAAAGAGPELAGGPGPLLAAGGVALALVLAGSALYLYRRR